MRRRKIFRRVFIYYAVILIIAIILIEFRITRIVRDNYINTLKDNLTTQAHLIRHRIPFLAQSDIDNLCRQLRKESGARITVILPDGIVLGDSGKDSSKMDNHLNRPEIQQAMLQGAGWSIRFSDTLKYDLLYTAVKITENDMLKGFIRMSVPLEQVQGTVNVLRFKILISVLLVLFATGLFFIWQMNRMRRFVLQITDFSRSLAQGSLDRRLYLQGAGEFNELSKNLNTMSEELKKNMDKREEETNRLNVILKSIPDALVIFTVDGMIEQSNKAFSRLFSEYAETGRPLIEIVRDPEFFSLVDRVRQSLNPGLVEIKIEHPENKNLEVIVSPLYYKEGILSGFVAIFHDTTHLKRLEQMRKDFVANVSHEIKTPVTAIKGFSETLLDGALNDRENAGRFLNTIRSHSERLNRLVDDLLTISRIELGVIKIEKSPLDVSSIIDNVIDTLRNRADAKGLSLRKSTINETITVDADRDRLLQILLNLVDNAIKFTESGVIEIGITADGVRKYLFVKDTGIGVSQKYLSRLGERFFRVDPSRSRELGGTGLGLAIVKHLVKAHGWEMEIESEEGKGTLVKIFVLS